MTSAELLDWYNFMPPKPYQNFRPSASVDGEYIVIKLWGGNLYLRSNTHGSLEGFIDDTSGG